MKQNHFLQAYKQAPWREQVKIASIFLLVLVVLALVAGFYLSINAQIAEAGIQIQLMDDDRLLLSQQIADGEIMLAKLTSANEMAKRARTLGFNYSSTTNSLYINVEGYQPVDIDYAPSSQSASSEEVNIIIQEGYTQSLWDWLVANARQADALLGRVK